MKLFLSISLHTVVSADPGVPRDNHIFIYIKLFLGKDSENFVEINSVVFEMGVLARCASFFLVRKWR